MNPLLLKCAKPLAVVCALALAFAAGRFTQPAHVEKTKKDETVKAAEKKEENKTTDTASNDQIKKHVERTVARKDGTTVTTKVDTVETKQVEVRVVDKVIDRIVYQDRIVTETKIVDYKKPWLHIGPDVSASLSQPGAFTFGGHVEVRAFGPVWVGVHANTRGAVTVGLSLEF